MKLATLNENCYEKAALIFDDGALPISTVNERFHKTWHLDILSIISMEQLEIMREWHSKFGEDVLLSFRKDILPLNKVKYGPLYKHPRKIWGIGLNYSEHANDLSEKKPTSEPASFMKADTTIIGYGDPIQIPKMSHKTTGEAELGIIIGKTCKDVKQKNWMEVVAGFTTIIDVTAEDILRKNPRYLTLSKNFDTFFSFGPVLVTPDEIEDVMKLNVATVINGNVYASNSVSNMTFPPDYLVAFHSQIMTLLPGDIISTGTPRAVEIRHGDIIECQIEGFQSLKNPVIDLKQ